MRHFLIASILCLVSTLSMAAANIRSFTWQPTITAAAYADGDQMGALFKLEGILPGPSGGIELQTVTLVDQGKQKRGLEVLLFSKAITLTSADNAASDISDADFINGFVGRISFASSDYVETANNADMTKVMDFLIRGQGSNHLWASIVCKDAAGCDYASATDLVFRFTYYE